MTIDEITLYALFVVMTLLAMAFVIPTLTRVGQTHSAEAETLEHRRALSSALRDEMARLKEDRDRGLLAEGDYSAALEDIERRVLEETRELNGNHEARTYRPAPVIAAVAALFAVVTIMGYGLKGSPELMRLADDQKVLEGKANIEQLETYLKDNHKDGRAWVLLARQRAAKDDFAGAVEAYRTAREVMTKVRNDPSVSLEMAAALLTTRNERNTREALPLLEAVHNLNPADERVTQLLVMAATDLEEWQMAANAVETLLGSMNPESPSYMEAREMLDRLRSIEQRAAQAKVKREKEKASE
mgnify:CR=1 FL=1